MTPCTMKKNILIIAVILLARVNVQSQTAEPERETTYKHSLGAGAGFTTGYGLSYRYRPGKFGAQINFAPYHDKETDRYSVGLTFLYQLIESKTTILYLYQGNHYYYTSDLIDVYDDVPPKGNTEPVVYKKRVKEGYFNNGLGIGIEFIIAKRIGLNLMGGYAFYDNFNQVNFTGETGLYFKF